MIDKKVFCNSLERIRKQMDYDKKTAELLKEAFGIESGFLYDNSEVIICIIELLSIWFEKSDLEHYIFDLNFGKPTSESEWITPEEFYDDLIK
jgi:hypothetical protein